MRYVRAMRLSGASTHRRLSPGRFGRWHVAAGTALSGIDEPGEDTSVSRVPNALVLLFPVIDSSKDGSATPSAAALQEIRRAIASARASSDDRLHEGRHGEPFVGAKQFLRRHAPGGNAVVGHP